MIFGHPKNPAQKFFTKNASNLVGIFFKVYIWVIYGLCMSIILVRTLDPPHEPVIWGQSKNKNEVSKMHNRKWIKVQTSTLKRVYACNSHYLEFPRPILTLHAQMWRVYMSFWCKICTMLKISVLSRLKARDGLNEQCALTSAYRYLHFATFPVENEWKLV